MDRRIDNHPILDIKNGDYVEFFYKDISLKGIEGEMISTALIANGIDIFGYHHKDNSPQGIFCANGQCAKCTIILNGKPVKSCITPLKKGDIIEPLYSKPPAPTGDVVFKGMKELDIDVLIVGGGPAGLKAAIELGKLKIDTLIVDDREQLGGKLVLQTHNFFGSIEDCYAGMRGIDIAKELQKELFKYSSVKIFTNSSAVAVFSDKKVGVLKDNDQYYIIKPKILLIATGARERSILFKGSDLPGVFGAGAFQTIVNRDLVSTSKRVFIVGGGNVGLIAAYHALQAGIEVIGVCEGLSKVGGYKVHEDKIKRLGVPVYLKHSIISANGKDHIESVTIAEIDNNWNPIKGTEKTFLTDTLLIAVGLIEINQFEQEAKHFGMKVFSAGDSSEVAEASAAMFSGKIAGLEIAKELDYDIDISEKLFKTAEILKQPPQGEIDKAKIPKDKVIYPVIHCLQEIPCNPCVSVCSKGSIKLVGNYGNIMDIPQFFGDCTGCNRCVAICPGLAITLVNHKNSDNKKSKVTIPFEFKPTFKKGDIVNCVDISGNFLTKGEIVKIQNIKKFDRRVLITIEVEKEYVDKVVAIPIQDINRVKETIPSPSLDIIDDDMIVCQCERVTAKEIRDLIKKGIRDINALKSTRATMGACGGKTCTPIIERLFKEEGVKMDKIIQGTKRPLSIEIPLGAFINKGDKS